MKRRLQYITDGKYLINDLPKFIQDHLSYIKPIKIDESVMRKWYVTALNARAYVVTKVTNRYVYITVETY